MVGLSSQYYTKEIISNLLNGTLSDTWGCDNSNIITCKKNEDNVVQCILLVISLQSLQIDDNMKESFRMLLPLVEEYQIPVNIIVTHCTETCNIQRNDFLNGFEPEQLYFVDMTESNKARTDRVFLELIGKIQRDVDGFIDRTNILPEIPSRPNIDSRVQNSHEETSVPREYEVSSLPTLPVMKTIGRYVFNGIVIREGSLIQLMSYDESNGKYFGENLEDGMFIHINRGYLVPM